MGQARQSGRQVIDPRFFDLFCGAFDTALQYVRQAETGKTHIGTHENWPEIEYHEENGLPWVKSTGESPKNYGDAIQSVYSFLFALGSENPPLDFRKEKTFSALGDYVKAQPRLMRYLLFDPNDSDENDFAPSKLANVVASALDRYIHTTNELNLDREKLLPIYLPLERHLFASDLPVTVVVPILFLKFDFSQFQIDEYITVEKLSDEFHLARGWRGSWSDSDNSLVESAATHGLFIRNLSMPNENWLMAGQVRMDPDEYPVEKIDTFFASLRTATGFPTGYAQMILLPVEWADHYAANLIPLSGPNVEKYPPFFKQGYWREQVPTVTSNLVDETKQLFEGLQQLFQTGSANRVRLGMNRLNLSATRTSDEDGIIDAMIALEALLSDGTQEMTHKVALRVAALYKILDRSRAIQTFTEMKRIYAFRSKVVHGSADWEKHREINRGQEKVRAIDAALEHLRNAFSVLIKNPALLDPATIDGYLLTDKF
jgi:hypothetical protein